MATSGKSTPSKSLVMLLWLCMANNTMEKIMSLNGNWFLNLSWASRLNLRHKYFNGVMKIWEPTQFLSFNYNFRTEAECPYSCTEGCLTQKARPLKTIASKHDPREVISWFCYSWIWADDTSITNPWNEGVYIGSVDITLATARRKGTRRWKCIFLEIDFILTTL